MFDHSSERILTIVASVATLINFAITMLALFSSPNLAIADLPDSLDFLVQLSFLTKLILIFLLETALAYAFGFLFENVMPEEAAPLLLVGLMYGTASAWLSYFNILFLMEGKPATPGGFAILGFAAFLAYLWGILFGASHGKDGFDNSVIMTIFPFVIVGIGASFS